MTAGSLATPAVAKMPDRGEEFIYNPVDSRCMNQQGSERHVNCDAM